MRFERRRPPQQALDSDAAASLVSDGGVPSQPTSVTSPTLPPSDSTPGRLLALPGPLVETYHRDTLVAMLDELDPDAVVATPPRANLVGATLANAAEIPIVSPAHSTRPNAIEIADSEILVVTIPTSVPNFNISDIRPASSHPTADLPPIDDEQLHRVCLTSRVSLAVDPYDRSTSLEELDAYAQQLPDGWLTGNTTHCSTALRAGFHRKTHVDGKQCSLVGIGQTGATLGVGIDDSAGEATLVNIYSNGAVSSESISPKEFGLRGIDGVGEKRAETLRKAGYTTPTAVADGSPHEFSDFSGFGRSTVTAIQAAATARAHDTVVATGNDALPQGDPIFIDIETDGLEPSVAWLIGVLDGGPQTGHYMAFTEPEPGDTSHLEAFLSWLLANASDRPLIAWNGYSFDFLVLTDQIRKHCPDRLDAWDEIYQYDLLWWARDKNGGNVALPGRSNKLEPVAEALGWEPQTTGIDGSIVAEIYTAYRRAWFAADDPHDSPEPDWERLEAYCEDDVRALATIYEALSDAARREPGTTTPSEDTSTQGTLSDFS